MIKFAKTITLRAALAVGMLATGGLMLSGDHGLGSTAAKASSAFSDSKGAAGNDKSIWGRPVGVKKHRHWRRHKWGWRHRWHKRWHRHHHKWSWDHTSNTKPPNQGISKPDLGVGGTTPPNQGIGRPDIGTPR